MGDSFSHHELVLVFGNGAITYNPQMVNGEPYLAHGAANRQNTHWGTIKKAQVKTVRTSRYPHSIIAIPAHSTKPGRHPTQKPIALMRYLVETYSNPGETLCDCFMGSGTTAIACIRTGRKFVGIEKDSKFFER